MKFKLEIEIGNDAMLDYDDLSQALIGMARKFDSRYREGREVVPGVNASVRDTNGNTVGHWNISE